MSVLVVRGALGENMRHAVATLAAISTGPAVVRRPTFELTLPPAPTCDEVYPERQPRKAHLSKWHDINKAMGGGR